MASTFDMVAKFRVDGRLLDAVAERAKRDGTSRSELIRAALKRELQEVR